MQNKENPTPAITSPCIAVFTSTATSEDAQKIVDTLLEKKLIACAQVQVVESHYRWSDNSIDSEGLERNSEPIQRETECRLLLKTVKTHYLTIERILLSMHNYELPAIYALPLSFIEPRFAEWIAQQTKGK